MRKLVLLLVALVVICLNMDNGSEAAPPAKAVPATSTISDSDGSGTFFRVQSDSLGSYRNGVNSVESIIQPIGDWELNATASTSRRVYIDFGDPVNPGDTTAPFPSAMVPARFISKCASLGLKMVDIPLGQTRQCPLALSFNYSGVQYRIAMNPVNQAGSEYIQWTCMAATSGKCTSWVMTPSNVQATGERKARGQLIKITTARGKTVETLLGKFYFAFKVNVTTP